MQSPSAPEMLCSLRIQIENNRVTAVGGRSFVPPDRLPAIFTPAAVAAAISELKCEEEDRLGLAADIQRRPGGVTTFAILVCIGHADWVVHFRRRGFLGRLPLGDADAQLVAGESKATFLRQQWDFLPFRFARGCDVEIDTTIILPFLHQPRIITVGKGFGDVHELAIHHSLQDFIPDAVSPLPPLRDHLFEENLTC
jgi:hypothetical protein